MTAAVLPFRAPEAAEELRLTCSFRGDTPCTLTLCFTRAPDSGELAAIEAAVLRHLREIRHG